MTNEVLFEEKDVSQIEKADRLNRYLRGTIVFIFEIIIVGFLIYFLGLLFFPLYILITWRYLARPIPITPRSYKITKQGVMFGEKNILWFNKVSKVTHNSEKKYVSLHRRLGFEMIRLYSKNSSNLEQIILSLISNEKTNFK